MRRSAADFHGFFRRQWIVIGIKKTEEAGVEPTEDANAPSNGFEARAPHRERYSSGVEHAAVSAAAEEALRPPRCLPLQLQFDHCQHIGGAVLPAQGS